MFFWDTGEMGVWSYPTWPPSPFKAVPPLLKQPDGITVVLKPCGTGAEPTSTKHRFSLHTLLSVRAILRELRWEYLLIPGSSAVMPAMSDPFRLCEQDPGDNKTLQELMEGLKGPRMCCAWTDPAARSCTGVGSGLQWGLFPPVWICSGVPALQTGTQLCL